MGIDVALMVRKAGVPVKGNGKSKEPVSEVHCFKCGKCIRSDDTSGVGYTRTRGGTELFFHEECIRKMGAL